MTEYEIKVYKLWYSDAPDAMYIGSTKRTIAQRMGDHRLAATKGVRTALIYKTMREKGVNNFEYCMLGSCMVSDKDQQRMFEQSYIDRLKPTLNMRSAYIHEDDRKQVAIYYRIEYRQTPGFKQKEKERHQTPEYKQKEKEREQTPKYKQMRNEYYQTPERTQQVKEYRNNPDNKERIRLYMQSPAVKQKQREYKQRRRLAALIHNE